MARLRDQLCFNGIDIERGLPLLPIDDDAAMREIAEAGSQRAVRHGVDPAELASAGWGVIFAPSTTPEVIEALAPLLEVRYEQATRLKAGRFRDFSGEAAPKPEEDALDWLARHGVGPGPVNPDRMPYYLLLVGDPQESSFEFQHELDVQYAVGRLHFDTADEYANYADAVRASLERASRRDRRVAIWAPENADDVATTDSVKNLGGALAERLRAAASGDGVDATWQIESHLASAATKACLGELVGASPPRGPDAPRPAILFTASHGAGAEYGSARQREAQGALLCQEWPGPRQWKGPCAPEHLFAAADVLDVADVAGLISFHFACYSAGTPQESGFTQLQGYRRKYYAPQPFVARLPQRLLAHPNGGALATVGHVDQAWGYSFAWRQLDQELEAFESALLTLMDGLPVGLAMEYFAHRYAELSTRVVRMIQRKESGRSFDPDRLSMLWTATNDAGKYIILGDPAVRLSWDARGGQR